MTLETLLKSLKDNTGKLTFTPDTAKPTPVTIEYTIISTNKVRFHEQMRDMCAEVLATLSPGAAAASSPGAAAATLSSAEKSIAKKVYDEYKAKQKSSLRFYFPDNVIIDVPDTTTIDESIIFKLVLKINSITNNNLDAYISKNNLKNTDGTSIDAGEIGKMKTVLDFSNADASNVKLLHNLFNKSPAGAAVTSSVTGKVTGTAAGEGIFKGSAGGGGIVKTMTAGGPSILQKLDNIEREFKNIETKVKSLSKEFLSASTSTIRKNEITKDMNILTQNESQLRLQKDAIMNDIRKAYSSRSMASLSDRDTYKINEDEYLINKSVEALKKNEDYIINDPNGGFIKTISSFSDLRDYIINHTSDPVTLLLKLTDIHPISLNDYLPAIEDDKLTIIRNDKGILIVKNNDEQIEMPNPSGNKHNRQAYSTKFKNNQCYGFGGPQSNEFCVSLLNNCLASDKNSLEKCRELFARDEWENVIDEGIQNTNIFFIKEFLLKIGYPRNNNKFDTNIDSWFNVIKSRYDITDASMLKNIQNNDKLKQAISGMVAKYNKIIEIERKSNSTSSRNFHLPMKGGDNMSIINSNLYELYGGLNQNVVNLPSLSPSQKVYNIFKELVKDQDITSKYRNFFDKMEKNIENQNHNIDSGVRQNFNALLESFKQSEEKLNKLLQTMHNFAWFLGQTVNTSNLSDAEKKINEEAADRLNKALNEENINAYNAAREKLVNSLNKKSQKLISIAAGHPFILIASS